jgi:hypothetical protein
MNSLAMLYGYRTAITHINLTQGTLIEQFQHALEEVELELENNPHAYKFRDIGSRIAAIALQMQQEREQGLMNSDDQT